MRTGNSPSYLIRNPYSYCFRMKVPKSLQKTICKKELRYSLGTGILSDAKAKARYLAGKAQLLFRDMHTAHFKDMNLTNHQIQSMIKKFMQELITNYDKPVINSAHTDGYKEKAAFSSQDGLEETIEFMDDIKADLNLKLHTGKYSLAERKADRLLSEDGCIESDIDKASPQYLSLCRGVYRAMIKGLEYRQNQLSGEFSDDLERELDSIINSNHDIDHTEHTPLADEINAQSPKEHIVTLGQLMKEFVAAKKKKWVPGAEEGFETTKKLIDQFLGINTPIHAIKRQQVRDFRDTLQCLPLRFTQSQHRNLSASEIRALELPTTEVISGSRVNSHLSYLTSMFNWAIKEKDYITSNPAMGMKVEEDKKSYDPFSKSDIVKIFSCDPFRKAKYPYQFWLPILGLYTGARREELCNLYEDDIKQDDGIWYIDIRQNRPDKRIKGKAGSPSERKVPLHPFVIELGFIEYVKTRKAGRLWPELNNNNQSQKYGVYFGKRFNDTVLKKTGIKPTKEQQQQGAGNKTFHSFRHTVITHLINLDLNIIKIKDVVGHEKGYGMTTGTYYHGQPIKKIYDEVISKIDYGLDLSHLKGSRFAISG